MACFNFRTGRNDHRMPSGVAVSRSDSSAFPLWPLPLAIAVSFIVAAHVALWLSIRDGHVAACVPVL